MGVVSIEDITVYYGSNSTAMSAARISTTILASMWACTRSIATLRTVSVVVRVCGFYGWSSWLGTCSPGSGAVRASSRIVDASTCLQDKRDEVVLVGVLRRFDRGVGLRCQSRRGTTALVDIALGPGAHHADVEDPVLPCLLTLMSPRLWSAPSSTLGSTVAEAPLTRPSTVASLSRTLSCLFVTRFHRRLQSRPWHGSVAKDAA